MRREVERIGHHCASRKGREYTIGKYSNMLTWHAGYRVVAVRVGRLHPEEMGYVYISYPDFQGRWSANAMDIRNVMFLMQPEDLC